MSAINSNNVDLFANINLLGSGDKPLVFTDNLPAEADVNKVYLTAQDDNRLELFEQMLALIKTNSDWNYINKNFYYCLFFIFVNGKYGMLFSKQKFVYDKGTGKLHSVYTASDDRYFYADYNIDEGTFNNLVSKRLQYQGSVSFSQIILANYDVANYNAGQTLSEIYFKKNLDYVVPNGARTLLEELFVTNYNTFSYINDKWQNIGVTSVEGLMEKSVKRYKSLEHYYNKDEINNNVATKNDVRFEMSPGEVYNNLQEFGETFVGVVNDCPTFSEVDKKIDTAISGIKELPAVTSADEGKILKVVNGVWKAVSP